MCNAIQKGAVSWSGDNPGIYLKPSGQPDADWQVLALYFRVAVSARGSGRGILLLGAPQRGAGYPTAPNLCMADNLPLMRYLLDEFVPCFAAFRGRGALAHVSLLQASSSETCQPDAQSWIERMTADGAELSLCWQELGKPFAADVPPVQSATGRHRMYSLFQGAGSAEIRLNGERLAGQVVERDFLGTRLSSAFLAFSETWVEEQPR